MRLLPTLMVLTTLGCASSAPTLIPVRYEFTDHPDEGRIELTWENRTGVTVCLTPEAWPNGGGWVYQGTYSVFLIVGGKRFPMEDTMWRYSSTGGGYSIRVAPGEKISASIPYENFNLPPELRHSQKRLSFVSFAERCEE